MKVLFISLDTLAASRLSTLGSTRTRTPNLDKFASEAALFTQAYASDIPTQPSHTALFTGRYGIKTGIVSHFHPPSQLEQDIPWLPTPDAGAWVADGRRRPPLRHEGLVHSGLRRLHGAARASLGHQRQWSMSWASLGSMPTKDDDFFLFLHYWDAHIPYVPPEPFKSEYTGAVAVGSIRRGGGGHAASRPSYPLFKRNIYDHLDRTPEPGVHRGRCTTPRSPTSTTSWVGSSSTSKGAESWMSASSSSSAITARS